MARYVLAAILAAILAVDAAFTICHLALISKLVVGVTALGEELQIQLALGKAELGDKLEENAEALHHRYSAEVARLEKYTRRFRERYHLKVNHRYHIRREDILAAAELAKEEFQRKRKELRTRRIQK